jgi:hypothetical protein
MELTLTEYWIKFCTQMVPAMILCNYNSYILLPFPKKGNKRISSAAVAIFPYSKEN